jgi:hypothetical protein
MHQNSQLSTDHSTSQANATPPAITHTCQKHVPATEHLYTCMVVVHPGKQIHST